MKFSTLIFLQQSKLFVGNWTLASRIWTLWMCILLGRGKELYRIIHVSYLYSVYFGLIPMCQFSVLQWEVERQVLHLQWSATQDSKSAMAALLFPNYVSYISHCMNDSLQPGSYARQILTVTYSSLYSPYLVKYVERRSCSTNMYCAELNWPTVSSRLRWALQASYHMTSALPMAHPQGEPGW